MSISKAYIIIMAALTAAFQGLAFLLWGGAILLLLYQSWNGFFMGKETTIFFADIVPEFLQDPIVNFINLFENTDWEWFGKLVFQLMNKTAILNFIVFGCIFFILGVLFYYSMLIPSYFEKKRSV